MTANAGLANYRFRTDMLPERDRVPVWREEFGRANVRLDMEPLGEGPFGCDIKLWALPDLAVAAGVTTPIVGMRTRELLSDNRHDVSLVIPTQGQAWVSQRGQEALLGPGEAVVLRTCETGPLRFLTDARYVNVCVPERALSPLLSNLDDAAMMIIPADNEMLRLLLGYLTLIHAEVPLVTPTTAHIVSAHIHDLVASAIGATREARAMAERHGVRTARLHAIKADIARHAGHAALSIDAVARRQRISPRYIRRLLASEDTTFSRIVLAGRLARAHRMLGDPGLAHRTISAIAFDVGFGDLSYFYRSFRQRYGATPSEIRVQACLRQGFE